MDIFKISPVTGKSSMMTLNITPKQVEDWQNGMKIQDAMPNLSVEEREFLISGLTLDEQSRVFREYDEEESE